VLQGIITQNVDNLHQDAGSATVIEFHGNGQRLVCLSCSKRYDAASAKDLGMPPACECGRVLKPDVVFFGEGIPQDAITAAMQLTQVCQVMLVVGTSATVAPASMFPHLAQAAGAMLVELNIEPTELTRGCDVVLRGDVVETLPRLAERVSELLARD
jgi:NAD-dependent deacetylase